MILFSFQQMQHVILDPSYKFDPILLMRQPSIKAHITELTCTLDALPTLVQIQYRGIIKSRHLTS